jgi:hypothetical protein
VLLAATLCMLFGALPGDAQDDVRERPATGASTPYTSVDEEVRQQELERLEHRVGRFASGEVTVYAGDLRAEERRFGRAGETLPRGRVVAALEQRADGSGHHLTVVSTEHGLWLRLAQSADAPGVTRVTGLRPLHGSPGITAECGGCLTELGEAPETIRLEHFSASGRLRDAAGTPFRVELSGRLERIAPSALELADLEPLDAGLDGFLRGEPAFERRGGEGVQTVRGELRRRVEPPPGSPSQMRCQQVTHYAAERFVDLADLGRSGVREVDVLGREICCFDHDAHGVEEQCSEEGGR